jgi:hydroxymethylpyrimidine/phosphomethylpyrimidine kinase
MPCKRPVVLCFSGHDPSGGAGIQADIESILSHSCHPCSVITALTEQDSCNVKKLIAQQPQDIIDQARTLFDDMPIAAIKIGLLGHVETVDAIATILLEHPRVPVIFDPVLAAGGGTDLASQELILRIRNRLLPLTTIITPNSVEARRLADEQSLDKCAALLLASGVKQVLITGTHEPSTLVQNTVYQADGDNETFNWERLPETYHGSGCTLASTIAALIAHGLDPFTAISEAQEYTWNALHSAQQPGKGQFTPYRLFWMEQNI